jgi:hypothetical protein
MKTTDRTSTIAALLLMAFLTLVTCVTRGQSLKLDIRMTDEVGKKIATDVQVKEKTTDGTFVLKTFQVKKGQIIIPLELGKEYVIHFQAPGKKFKTITVDCTEGKIDWTYTFAFDVVMEKEPEIAQQDHVGYIWLENKEVKYRVL